MRRRLTRERVRLHGRERTAGNRLGLGRNVMMRAVLAAIAGTAAILAGSASASVVVGVNDDAAKDAAVAPWFYSTMTAEGLELNNLTLRWDDNFPTEIPGQAAVEQAIAKANAAGVGIELNLYPLHSQ